MLKRKRKREGKKVALFFLYLFHRIESYSIVAFYLKISKHKLSCVSGVTRISFVTHIPIILSRLSINL